MSSSSDWGFSRDGSVKSIPDDAATGESNGPSSRYDPKAMSRIVDITDLVDADSDVDSDDDIVGHSSSKGGISGSKISNKGGGRSSSRRQSAASSSGLVYNYGIGCRQVLILVSLVAIIVGASVAIGYAVINVEPSKNNTPQLSVRGGVEPQGEEQEQHFLEIAERVITACSESSLDADMADCQELCHASMCCFETGEYGCEDDERKNCAVYAGCANLMEGLPLDAAEEDEE